MFRTNKDHTKIDLQKEEWKVFKNNYEPIIIHQQTKVDGKKYQQIDIYIIQELELYYFRQMNMILKKEFQNLLKDKIKTA